MQRCCILFQNWEIFLKIVVFCFKQHKRKKNGRTKNTGIKRQQKWRNPQTKDFISFGCLFFVIFWFLCFLFIYFFFLCVLFFFLIAIFVVLCECLFVFILSFFFCFFWRKKENASWPMLWKTKKKKAVFTFLFFGERYSKLKKQRQNKHTQTQKQTQKLTKKWKTNK